MYDVYYTTGFGNKVGAGSDVWVNNFVEHVVPHLTVKPILLIHRKKPEKISSNEFIIEKPNFSQVGFLFLFIRKIL